MPDIDQGNLNGFSFNTANQAVTNLNDYYKNIAQKYTDSAFYANTFSGASGILACALATGPLCPMVGGAALAFGTVLYEANQKVQANLDDAKRAQLAQIQPKLNAAMLLEVNRLRQSNQMIPSTSAIQGFDLMSNYINSISQLDISVTQKSLALQVPLTALNTHTNLLLDGQTKVATSLSDFVVSNSPQQIVVSQQLSATVGILGTQLQSLSGSINSLKTKTTVNTQDIQQLQQGLSSVKQTLSSQTLMLSDIQTVTDLVFTKLTAISADDLELYGKYNQNIQRLSNEYKSLVNSGASKTVILAKYQELNTELTARVQTAKTIQGYADVGTGIANFFQQVGQTQGNEKLQQFGQVLGGAVQVGVGIASFVNLGITSWGAFLAAGSVVPVIAPAIAVVAGVMMIFSAFSKSKKSSDNTLAIALQQISQQIQALSQQVEALSNYVEVRFNQVDNEIADINYLVSTTFKDMVKLLQVFNQEVMDEFVTAEGQLNALQILGDQINDKLTTLHTAINAGFQALYGQTYHNIKVSILQYYQNSPYGTVPPLDPTVVRQAVLATIDWATYGAMQDVVNGNLDHDYRLSTLANIDPENILNYVNKLLGVMTSSQGLGLTLTPAALPKNLTAAFDQACPQIFTSNPTKTINPLIWASAVNDFIQFVMQTPEYVLTKQDRCLVQQFIQSGVDFLKHMQALKSHPQLFNTLIDGYNQNFSRLVQLMYQNMITTLNADGQSIYSASTNLVTQLNQLSASQIIVSSQVLDMTANIAAANDAVVNSCFVQYYSESFLGNYAGTCPASNGPDRNRFGSGQCDGFWIETSQSYVQNVGNLKCRSIVPNLPNTDCHNLENIRMSMNVTTMLRNACNAAADGRYTGISLSTLSSISWNPTYNKFFNASLSILPTNFLMSLKNSYFSDFVFSGGETLVNYFNVFVNQINNCKDFAIRYFYHNNDPYAKHHDDGNDQCGCVDNNQFSTSWLSAVQSNVQNGQISYSAFARAYQEYRANYAAAISTKETLSKQLSNFNALNVQKLFYKQDFSLDDTKEALLLMQSWLRNATLSDQARLLQQLTSASNTQTNMVNTLNQLSSYQQGLHLFLSLAFSDEFTTDVYIRKRVLALWQGDNFRLQLSNMTVPIMSQMLETFFPQNTSLLNETKVYLQDVIARGQALLAEGQLMPGHYSLLGVLQSLIFIRDNVFPPTNLSPVQVVPSVILSACQANNNATLTEVQAMGLMNVVDSNGNTAFLQAAANCDIATVQKLTNMQVALNVKNNQGFSALNLAVMGCISLSDMNALLTLLLQQGVTACRASDALQNALMNFNQALLAGIQCMIFSNSVLTPTTVRSTSATQASSPTTSATFSAETQSASSASQTGTQTTTSTTSSSTKTTSTLASSASTTNSTAVVKSEQGSSSSNDSLSQPVTINLYVYVAIGGGLLVGILAGLIWYYRGKSNRVYHADDAAVPEGGTRAWGDNRGAPGDAEQGAPMRVLVENPVRESEGRTVGTTYFGAGKATRGQAATLFGGALAGASARESWATTLDAAQPLQTISDPFWSCRSVSSDQLHCTNLDNTKQRIVSRLNSTPWSDIQGDEYYHCESYEKDGIPVRQCLGEKTEMVELEMANSHVQIEPSISYQLGSSALMGAAFAAIPEIVGDSLYLSGWFSERNANYVKQATNIGLILWTGSWMSVLVSISTAAVLQQLGYSESTARMVGSTAAFLMNIINQLTLLNVAAVAANYAGARVGLWAEKLVVNQFSACPSSIQPAQGF
jgi:hypothetical protein